MIELDASSARSPRAFKSEKVGRLSPFAAMLHLSARKSGQPDLMV
jgi:hypothetical protein